MTHLTVNVCDFGGHSEAGYTGCIDSIDRKLINVSDVGQNGDDEEVNLACK